MTRVNTNITNFTAGEWSPQLYGRTDLAKYLNACRTCKNFITRVHGGAQRRPGTMFVNAAKYANKLSRLLRFEFSITQAYAIEAGDKYLRFYKDRGLIVNAYAAWTPSYVYAIGDLVTEGSPTAYYRCLEAHTSGTFATDLAAGKWEAATGSTDLAYEIPSPYIETDLAGLRWVQDADVMYIVNENVFPQQLTRSGHTAWTIDDMPLVDGPYLDENTVDDTGSSQLCPDGDMELNTGWSSVGSPTTQEQSSDRAYSGAYSRKFIVDAVGEGVKSGTFTSVTSQIYRLRFRAWTAAKNISFSVRKGDNSGFIFTDSKSDVAASEWVEYERYYVETAGGAGAYVQFVNATGTSGTFYIDKVEIHAVDTILVTPSAKTGSITLDASETLFESGHVGAFWRLRYGEGDDEETGYALITAFTSSTQVSATVQKELPDTAPTPWWREGAFSPKRGYPSVIAFYEQRLIFGATPDNPQTIWASKTREYTNFAPGSEDTDSYSYTIKSDLVQVIKWMTELGSLMIGTVNGVWKVGSTDSSAAITPSNVTMTQQNRQGAASVEVMNMGSALLFVQRQGKSSNAGRRIRELSYDLYKDRFVGADISLLSEHLLREGLIEWDFQASPFPIIWGIRDDGTLITVTYERDQDVIGWHQHPTDGIFESVTVIPGDNQDEPWFIVNRTINSSTVRYIEYLEDFDWGDDQKDCHFVDSGLVYDGAAVTSLSGLGHLEGETVEILADGAEHPTKVVSSGSITLNYAASVVHAGLGYTSDLATMDLEGGNPEGTAQGKQKRIHSASIRFINTMGGKIGPDENDLNPIILRTTDDDVGEAVPLYSGIPDMSFEGGWEMERRVLIRQTGPLPMTVLSIMPNFRSEGK